MQSDRMATVAWIRTMKIREAFINGMSSCAVLVPFAIILIAGVARSDQQTSSAGIVVEEVGADSALGRAGVQVGDVLLSWERPLANPQNPVIESASIYDAYDLMWLEIEQAPRAPIRLLGRRGEQPVSFLVEQGIWSQQVRPHLSEEALAFYLRGQRLILSGEVEEGAFFLERAFQEERDLENAPQASWIHFRLGKIWSERSRWSEAHEQYRLALLGSPSTRANALIYTSIGIAYALEDKFVESEVAHCSALSYWNSLQEETLGKAISQNAIGYAAWKQGDFNRAEDYFKSALTLRQMLAPKSLPTAESLDFNGLLSWSRGDLRNADIYYRAAIEIKKKIAPYSLAMADSLTGLANVMADRGDTAEAKETYLKSLEIARTLEPESPDVIGNLLGLGNLASNADLDVAASYYKEALDIQEKTAPESLLAAAILNNLAGVLSDRGDIITAQLYYSKALRTYEALSPEHPDLAAVISNIATLAKDLGDMEAAESLYKRALLIQKRAAPKSLNAAVIISSLGSLAEERTDFELAEDYFNQALRMLEELSPESPQIAATIASLGTLAWAQGDAPKAEKYLLRALSIEKMGASESLSTAILLNNLGNIAWAQGKTQQASTYLSQALEIETHLSPNGIDLAWTLQNLGHIARDSGDSDLAIDYLQRALRIKEKLTPNSSGEAEVLYILSLLYKSKKRPELALDFAKRTLDSLEAQIRNLGGSHDIKANFRAFNHQYYRHMVELLLEQGATEEAFRIQESSRARSFIAMLAERDLLLTLDIPADLQEERARLAIQYDRLQEEVLNLTAPQGGKELEILLSKLHNLRHQIEESDTIIRRSSPRLAGLRYPEIIDAESALAALDSGTLMLSYSVGQEKTDLFILGHGKKLQVLSIQVGEEELRRAVTLFSALLQQSVQRGGGSASRLASLRSNAMDLYKSLIEPVSTFIEGSDRLLIIPDGPLHLLPWGALMRSIPGSEAGNGRFQYLVEWKPIHTTLSATTYSEIRKRNRLNQAGKSSSPIRIAAFGDPVFPTGIAAGDARMATDARVQSAAERGFRFEPIASTRREVEEISRLYPQELKSFLGPEATEENAKSLPQDISVIHFATHGILDERFPLNSAVVLSIPANFEEGRDNGLLQAWEIFERIRTDADLVVLSACESGLGKEMRGEGLIGLTRAFQYAGARSVMASLWKISDRTTAELMVRFYRHLKEGKPKDEALRAAQMELIRGPIQVKNEKGEVEEIDASAPYYWAAFQVYGDWQ